jgi:hypothetical protein
MSDAIPKPLMPVAAAVEAVCAELKAKGEFQFVGSGRWLRNLPISEELVAGTAFVLDEDWPLLVLYVVLELPKPGARQSALVEAIARANYGLLPGCFEIDFDTGEVRFRSVMMLQPTKVNPKGIAQMLSDGLQATKIFAPALRKVVKSGRDPAEAIAEVEELEE